MGILKGATDNSVMAEVYEPSTESWALLSSPGLVRFQSEVVQLPDGRILVAGGETEASPPPVPTTLGIVKWTDIYDPSGDTWRRVADTNHFREYHAVTLLVPDGRVLTTGGTRIKFQVGPTSNDIEAFSPPYLFRGVRPEITSVSSTQPRRGDTMMLGISPDTQITSAVLLGIQTTTHWVDAGVPRRQVLPVVQADGQVEIVLPTDPNLLPLGHYMLFAMVDDIPSEAVVVQVLEADATPAGRIPDGNVVPGIPLTVGKAGGTDLTLNWGASCHSPDTDYEIYRGTLGDFATHSPVTCSTGGSTQAIVAAADPENRYYLVVPRNPSAEGSYGSDSLGQPRDQGAEACLPRLIAGCAP